MYMSTHAITQKIWNYCHTLRDEGIGYGDYLEQITYLLFLKMADEYSKPPYNRDTGLPAEYAWPALSKLTGAELEEHYRATLQALGKKKGMLGQIFTKAQNKIQDPAKLYRLVKLIDQEQWTGMDTDVKGDIYEGLLQKNAEDTKSGAGQYFTPRPLIQAMVACLQPQPMRTIADPACGTGGFFLSAYDHIAAQSLNREQKQFLKEKTFYGWELVSATAKLGLMNLFLHNIGKMDSHRLPITRGDSLLTKPSESFDYVLANPPFGRKSSVTYTNEEGDEEKEDLYVNRQDFWTSTSNKQLNFLQHIVSMLKPGGEAAVVLPDNVLFEGGAGETVRRKLMQTCELHTVLRLPTGIFYAQGVKANVLFFTAKTAAKDPWTKEVWYYDYRTNVHHTLKKNPMRLADLQDFINCYNPDNRHHRKELWSEEKPDGRWRRYTYEELVARDKASLDLFWLRDDTLTDMDNLPDPDTLAAEIIEDLEAALESFRTIGKELED
ncbi:N-6 DNA methylase [Roseivirga sp. BDSF3-8]|uniref:class I SAM-dependent DNA methyltransferase n=1 Tax=Roseivirga sp. BDSF3-8 TaxID=3241598 RepID=UPI003532608D